MTAEHIPPKDKLSNCEICGGEMDDLIVSLPIRQPDGSYDTFACLDCAEQSNAYCLTHERPHVGFEDGTTACLVCIEEKVVGEGPRVVVEFFQEIQNSPHKEDILEGLERWSQTIPQSGLFDPSENVARAIITAAIRLGRTTQEIVNQVSEDGLDVILPPLVREHVDRILDQETGDFPAST